MTIGFMFECMISGTGGLIMHVDGGKLVESENFMHELKTLFDKYNIENIRCPGSEDFVLGYKGEDYHGNPMFGAKAAEINGNNKTAPELITVEEIAENALRSYDERN